MKKGIMFSLITALLFVTLEPVSKLIANSVNPYAITFWRFLIGSVILVIPATLKIKKEKIKITPKDILIMTGLGIMFICISMVTLQIAVKKADSPSLIAIIFSANSVFTILFSFVLVKEEKLTKNKIIAVIFGIAGVLLCTDFSSGTNLTSVALALCAAISFSLYTALSRKYMKTINGVVQSAGVFLTGSIVLLIALLCMRVDVSIPMDINSLMILVYLGLFVTGVGYASYFLAMERGGAIMASLAFFIKPILTPFATLFIVGIAPDIKVFIAIGCIIIASYFAVYKKAKK